MYVKAQPTVSSGNESFAEPPECQKYRWGQAHVVGIICPPPPPLVGVELTEIPNSGWAAHPLMASLLYLELTS
jgi:hypothetical protein